MPEDTDNRGTAPKQIVDYEAFLSHAREDKPWCEQLAVRVRDEGARV